MSGTIPRFDRPAFSVDPADVVSPAEVGRLGASVRLPPLVDTSARLPEVQVASGEPMVRVAHRRIRCLANYWHAGWQRAIPDTWLRASVAERLYMVAESLPSPWGLAIYDAWRPLELQGELYRAAYADPDLPPGFLAEPVDDARHPPPHLTGGTVDLTLTWECTPLALGTDFDSFVDDAALGAFEDRPGLVRDLRRALYHRMHATGFVAYEGEWWHYEWGTCRWAMLTGLPAVLGPDHPVE